MNTEDELTTSASASAVVLAWRAIAMGSVFANCEGWTRRGPAAGPARIVRAETRRDARGDEDRPGNVSVYVEFSGFWVLSFRLLGFQPSGTRITLSGNLFRVSSFGFGVLHVVFAADSTSCTLVRNRESPKDDHTDAAPYAGRWAPGGISTGPEARLKRLSTGL